MVLLLGMRVHLVRNSFIGVLPVISLLRESNYIQNIYCFYNLLIFHLK